MNSMFASQQWQGPVL